MIERLPVAPGDRFLLEFIRVSSPWRQGLWLATDGQLAVGGFVDSQHVIWTDSADPLLELTVLETTGGLVFYNVWDSGRGRRGESQSATSGMVVADRGDGVLEYGCTDIGLPPDFSKLVFRLTRQ